MSSMVNVSVNALSMNGVITLSDGMGTIIENGQVDTLNLAVSGFTAVGVNVAVGQDLAVGNNIVNSGSIITGKDIQCNKLLTGNLVVNNQVIRSDTQSQINYLYNYLGLPPP